MSFWTDPIAVIANLISGWLSGLGMTAGWDPVCSVPAGGRRFALVVMLFVVLLDLAGAQD